MTFSTRLGYKSSRLEMQIEEIDEPLRNGIWNTFLDLCTRNFQRYSDHGDFFLRQLWASFFKRPLDEIPTTTWDYKKRMKSTLFNGEWYLSYDLIEFILKSEGCFSEIDKEVYVFKNNKILEEEQSAYRIIGNEVTPITDNNEINEIDTALKYDSKFKPVSDHINEAVSLLSERNNPSFRNVIKESISAVEAVCQILSGDSNASLGKALDTLEKQGFNMHPSLKGAFDRLYGYASDADGIRHALLEDSNLDFHDAKFMLVACSSFVNFLIAKSTIK